MKRGKVASYVCASQPCGETGYFSYSNREQGMDLQRRYSGKWKCIRHTKPEEVLTRANPHREMIKTLTLGPSGNGPGLYWIPQDGGGMVSGFAYGDGWKAFHEDFPAGTRIVVRTTIDVEIPS